MGENPGSSKLRCSAEGGGALPAALRWRRNRKRKASGTARKNRKRPSETSPQPPCLRSSEHTFQGETEQRLYIMPHARPSTAIPYQLFTVKLCIIRAGCFSFPFISVLNVYTILIKNCTVQWPIQSFHVHQSHSCT